MSLEQNNKAIVQEYFDRYWAKGDSSVVDELCTDDFLISYPNHGSHHGKKAAKAMIDEFREVRITLSWLV
jgi:ketosteroid isomerase-like protein